VPRSLRSPRSPRALLAWVAALVVALCTARIVAVDLASLHRRAASLGPQRAVVMAARDLPLGSTLRGSDLRVTRIYASLEPRGAQADPSLLVGRVVAVPVLSGEPVLARHLAPASRTGLDGVVPAGSRAVRVVTDDGLRPRAGDVVDVLVSLDPSIVVRGGGGEGAATVARAARVLAVDDGGGGTGKTAGGVGVTLLVTETEARALAFAAANGSMMLALAPPEAACCPNSTTQGSG
jgi:pilus assembly protein CpaB